MDVCKHKQAKFNYELLEFIECGIVLTGNEIKSIRQSKTNLKGSFCKFMKNELYVFEMHVGRYELANTFSKIDEKKPRKLLLHRKQLNKLQDKLKLENLSLIPTRIYFNENNKCKIEIALAKGKKNYDKRNDLKEKSLKRKIDQDYKQQIK